ncbi:hypothetical protein PA598K_04919 [Paenibacillus sp. 598K]|uniref:Flp1 family type IVb pilin n=1 Tax=Paenibacillus sp. 598K TaxID=1117987 RepID=UPI000FF96A2C|nr:Flp1 family type IVb pilin [Paenibacillus sp. 598K]GBF76446.1 hypothetical protein PA598K_04919 [Paenibacillus sp. 598K]
MKMSQMAKQFWNEEDGIGTLEIVLIIAVIVVIAIIFKDWIIGLVKDILEKAGGKANGIFTEPK